METNLAVTEAARPMRVLVVDDNEDAANSLAMLVRTEGHQVNVAYGGALAVQAAREQRPDAILLDIGLPDIDGYSVVALLRQLPETRATFIVAVTGLSDEGSRKRSKEVGFDLHLVKPVNAEQVLGLLSAYRKMMVEHLAAPAS